jgi:broad specificity phosphatase PhoE
MSTKIIFIRHLETNKNPNLNSSEWVLSDSGFQNALELAESPLLNNSEVIYTSSEIKTLQTIKPLAEKLNLKIIQNENFDEVRRGDKFLTDKDFEQEKIKQLEDLYYPAFDGETSVDALKRFSNEIKKIINDNKNKTVVVVSHGTILNLYFANLQNNFNEIVDRWKNTKFGAIGIVEDEEVSKDIVEILESYPNLEKFLSNLGLVITYSTKQKIVFKFAKDKDFRASQEEFILVQENPNSTGEDYKRVWENKHRYEKLFFPKLKPLFEKLDKFYENRNIDYKYHIFLNAPALEVLNLGPFKLTLEFFSNDEDYKNLIYKELKDFDNFLENQ